MGIKSVKEWRSDPLTCVSGHPAEVIDWLIAEVERLTAKLQTAQIHVEAMRLVLAPLSVKAGVSEEKLLALLDEAKRGVSEAVRT